MTEQERSERTMASRRSRLARLAALAAALTVPALVITMQLYAGYRLSGMRFTFLGVFVLQLVLWELWVVFGPLVWNLERRWPWGDGQRRTALVRHAVAAPAIAVAVLAIFLIAYHTLLRLPLVSSWFAGMDRDVAQTISLFFASYFHVELLIYGAIVAVAHATRTTALLHRREQEALRLEAELTGAKLTALRTQLQPHFLFNTLHTIGSLVLQRRTEQAVQLIAELGELLRSTLAHRDTDLAPLRDELAYLQRYLKIEEARFGDRLRVEWDIDPAALDALVPPFILQPLIENAFRHGISRRTEDSVLRVAATMEGQSLRITVYNDGPPLAESFAVDAATGYGLHNVRERLRTRNPAGRIELGNVDAGVRVTLVLPLWAASTARAAQ